jgi:hypothetical protein
MRATSRFVGGMWPCRYMCVHSSSFVTRTTAVVDNSVVEVLLCSRNVHLINAQVERVSTQCFSRHCSSSLGVHVGALVTYNCAYKSQVRECEGRQRTFLEGVTL